jgi:hypothetical protein
VKKKLADVTLVGLAGADVIDVSGGVRSTTQENAAGLGSTIPAASVARTPNVWLPAERSESVVGLAQAAHWPASRRQSKLEPGSLAAN